MSNRSIHHRPIVSGYTRICHSLTLPSTQNQIEQLVRRGNGYYKIYNASQQEEASAAACAAPAAHQHFTDDNDPREDMQQLSNNDNMIYSFSFSSSSSAVAGTTTATITTAQCSGTDPFHNDRPSSVRRRDAKAVQEARVVSGHRHSTAPEAHAPSVTTTATLHTRCSRFGVLLITHFSAPAN